MIYVKIMNRRDKLNKYIVVDIETTGLNPDFDKIIEIGAIKVENNQIVDKFSRLIDPEIKIPHLITEITGIDDSMIAGQDIINNVIPSFVEFCKDFPIMGHNLPFDYSFLKINAYRLGYEYEKDGIDTLRIARIFLTDLESRSLENLCKYYGIVNAKAHRAYEDAYATKCLYDKMYDSFYENNNNVFRPHKMKVKIKKDEQITTKQKSYLNNLIKYHKIDNNRSLDTYTKSEASREIDRIILNYGKISW